MVCATEHCEFDFPGMGIYYFITEINYRKKNFYILLVICNQCLHFLAALPPASVPVSSSPNRYACNCKIRSMFHFPVISTTYETDDGSKATNTVPHSSPLDVLQTTTMAPNETAEPFCLVMGKLLITIVIASFCSFPLLPPSPWPSPPTIWDRLPSNACSSTKVIRCSGTLYSLLFNSNNSNNGIHLYGPTSSP